MTARADKGGREANANDVRLDRLLGRVVLAANNRPVGRLEEFRAEKHGDAYVITEYVIGAAGLLERLGVRVQRFFGRSGGGRVAGWQQLDISNPEHPRLTCPVDALKKQ